MARPRKPELTDEELAEIQPLLSAAYGWGNGVEGAARALSRMRAGPSPTPAVEANARVSARWLARQLEARKTPAKRFAGMSERRQNPNAGKTPEPPVSDERRQNPDATGDTGPRMGREQLEELEGDTFDDPRWAGDVEARKRFEKHMSDSRRRQT